MNSLSDRQQGIALVAAGSILLSPDSMLLRLMATDVWTILVFRGLCGCVGFLVIMRLQGTPLRMPRSWPTRASVAIVCLSAVANTCFVYSVRHTAVALALAIIATAPAFTAILGAVFVGDRVEPRTRLAIVVVLAGVGSIFAWRPQGGPLLPDLTALCGALALATMIVVVRRTGGRDVVAPQAAGALVTGLVVLPFADPLHVGATTLAIAAGAGLLLLPTALFMVMRGPRYLLAAEVSLLLLLETVLGPVWVWVALGEAPSVRDALTAAVIVVALAVSALQATAAVDSPVHGRPRGQ
jgi:drug/metabolite transporter (DMT)-like permease